MNVRKKNFFIGKKVLDFLVEKDNILLFVHQNNLNDLEYKWIISYCKLHKIDRLVVKSSIYRKLIKNEIFFKLFNGPTKIYKFKTMESFVSFFDLKYIKEKLLPLTIYWKNNFYSYSFFSNYLIMNLSKNNNFLINLPFAFNNFLTNLKFQIKNNICFVGFFKLILLLDIIKNKKKYGNT